MLKFLWHDNKNINELYSTFDHELAEGESWKEEALF